MQLLYDCESQRDYEYDKIFSSTDDIHQLNNFGKSESHQSYVTLKEKMRQFNDKFEMLIE